MNSFRENIRILHVDDEPGLTDLAATFLEREDERFTVRTATSANEGLNQIAQTEFDCIISDYDMPGQNGVEFLKSVRDIYPDLPFILFTGKGSEEIASEAISAGVSDYLQKGSGSERYSLLANRIANLVSQYRAESQLEDRARQQECIAELGKKALSGVALETLFEDAVTMVADVLGNEYAKVLEYQPAHDNLLLRAGIGWQEGLVGEATVGIGEDSQAGHTLRSEEPIVVEDLSTESRFRGPPLLVEHDVVSGISVIIGSQDDPWGVLGTHTTQQTVFSDDDVTFLQNVANILATAIKRAEHETELRQKTRAIEEAPVGITITDPSQEDNPLTYVNDRFKSLTEYDEEEIIGRNCRFLQGENTEEAKISTMREAINNQNTVTVELRNYRKDGTEFWNRVSIAPITGESGTLRNFVGFQEDVTQRKEHELEREATIDFLQYIYDMATNTQLEFEDKVTQLLRVGPEKLDLPYGHLTKIDIRDPVNDEGTQTVIEASGDHELLQPGGSCSLSQSYCRKTIKEDGLLAIEDTLKAGWEDDPAYNTFQLGCYIGVPVVVNDELYGTIFFASSTPREEPFSEAERTFVRLMSQVVSYELEREQMMSELKEQNERLEEFASVVSHDLRNPLRVAEGHLELAREECDSEYLETVADAHHRMGDLIEDLLTLSQQDAPVSDMESVDLHALAEICWQNVATAEATLVAENLQTVEADRSRLQQILENLIRNAVEHGGDDVTVTIGRLGDGFYVEDDGPGIPVADQAEIFEAGYSTTEGGTGFGLSIVKKAVDAHGWDLRVTNGTEGGARFEITGVTFPE